MQHMTFLGHLCIDRNVVAGEEHLLYGGGAVHGAVTAARLGEAARVRTRLAPDDAAGFGVLAAAGVPLEFRPCAHSTSIRNDYGSGGADGRVSTLLARAEPFGPEDLRDLDGDLLHVNPLWFGELPVELLAAARSRVPWLSLDAQGLLRRAGADGRLALASGPPAPAWLPLLDLLKLDLREAEALTGLRDPSAIPAALGQRGLRAGLLTWEEGALAWEGERQATGRFGPYPLAGRTGRGDTCTAAFLVARRRWGLSLDAALDFALALTTAKMQVPGVYAGGGPARPGTRAVDFSGREA